MRLTFVVGYAFCPIRLQDSLIINTCKKNQGINFFVHRVSHEGKAASEATTLVGFCHLCFSSKQIARFFDHQYLWKELTHLLDFYAWR